MTEKALRKAVELAERVGHVFVVTSDGGGLPHVAAAGQLRLVSDRRVMAGAFFCPGTLDNLAQNRRIAVVVWDPASDDGCQILGHVEEVTRAAVLDGYAPEAETTMPQEKEELLIRVQRVLRFTRAPHSDVEE